MAVTRHLRHVRVPTPPLAPGARRWLLAFGSVLALIGLVLTIGGMTLIRYGGSWYYLLAGLGLLLSGVLVARRQQAGATLFAIVFIGTLIWALWEAGWHFWPQVPRLAPMLVLALAMLLLLPLLRPSARRAARAGAALTGLVLAAGLAAVFVPHGVIDHSAQFAKVGQPQAGIEQPGTANWPFYGRTPSGTRYAPFDQINKDNVGQLEVAWTFRTGDVAGKGAEDQHTPTQIGDTVYVCTPYDKVFALDADTGSERWRYDAQSPDSQLWNRCRGVAHFDAAAYRAKAAATPASNPAPTGGACAQRVYIATVDARLIALDAHNGLPCEGFGEHGVVSLRTGMGLIQPFYYMPTSMPTVMGNMILLGGWVQDGASVDEPSGVVRAFNAETGELAWAWDLGNPAITKLPPPGQTYTRTTPNVWSTPAFDEKLGLVYLPTGNQTPDFWGGERRASSDEYNSSVVALDIATGRPRWHFRTTNHDLWDYDVPSQPALVDLPDGHGATVPALVQLTKRGQIFLLDRATGKPLAEVADKSAPINGAAGERPSPVQPYSVGMPAIGTEPLSEARMWGATFFDQLWCRIAFRKMRYDGDFTLPHLGDTSLQYPGNYGGFNWGSGAIDEKSGTLYATNMNMPMWIKLVTRAEADDPNAPGGHDGLHVQAGTPFGVKKGMFMSPLGVPCHEPPYGQMTAIDLNKREIVWQRPLGTIQDTVLPIGMRAHLPVPLGMPPMGGPVATASGLIFFGGTQDFHLRAIDAHNGKVLWAGRLPVGAQATPMSYVSPASGRQYVVIAAGGQRQSPMRGDYVIAYALPKEAVKK